MSCVVIFLVFQANEIQDQIRDELKFSGLAFGSELANALPLIKFRVSKAVSLPKKLNYLNKNFFFRELEHVYT